MIPNKRIKYLFEKYLAKKYSPEERDELFQLINGAEHDAYVQQLINETWETEFLLHEPGPEKKNSVFQNIIAHHVIPERKVKKLTFLRYAVAAGIVGILLSVGAYFYITDEPGKQIAITPVSNTADDIAPGGNKAVLTLAGGEQIILDSANNGTLTQQGNARIIKLSNGELSYNTVNEKPGETLYNSISTPKGGQYQILLADGSKVWLNAASSLRFPASFTGNERNVELTGEGYFEIAKNAQKPFHVTVNDMRVEVLGTHFNINSYADEPAIKTTLLEGKVVVTKAAKSVALHPGQQAQVVPGAGMGGIRIQNDVDLAEVVAWKNGIFNFTNVDLQILMRQLSRWYDVDIIYEGKIPERKFEGKIQRDLSLGQVLRILNKNNVNFRLEGKKLIVVK